MNEVTIVLERVFLPGYLLAYIIFTYTLPVAAFKRRYGIDPEKVQSPDPVMHLIERYRDGIFAVTLLIVFANALEPRVLRFLPSIAFLNTPAFGLAGMAMMVGSLFVVRAGQRHLRASWRVGFDRAAPPTTLMTAGVYARSRNPIFVGLIQLVLGFFLVLPNALTLTIALVTIVLLQVRVLIEEQHLVSSHGDAYLAYCSVTPRWLFRATPPAQPTSAATAVLSPAGSGDPPAG